MFKPKMKSMIIWVVFEQGSVNVVTNVTACFWLDLKTIDIKDF